VPEPRRRVVRPALAGTPAPDLERQRRLARLRDRLERERSALARWFAKLRRAFHAVEKCQARITRIEREIDRQQT
jgi:hypothetical protein